MAELDRLTARAGRWLPTAFPVIVAAGLVVTPVPVWALAFYLSVPVLVALRLRGGWRPHLADPAVALALALVLWSSLAVVWGYDPSGHGRSAWVWLGNGVCTLAFLLGGLAATERADGIERVEIWWILGGAANALASILQHLAVENRVSRLYGWGITGEAVMGGAVVGALFVLTLDRLLRRRGPRIVQAACLVGFGVFLVMSGGRGAVLAVAVAVLYRMAAESRRVWAWVGGAGVAAAVVAVAIDPRGTVAILRSAAMRGSDQHVTLWRIALHEIVQRPVLGFGPAARFPVSLPDLPYSFPHNLYLSLLFYSGAVGLVIFLALIVVLLVRLRRIADRALGRGRIALLLVPLVGGLTDFSQIIKGPAPIWFVFWLPLLCCLDSVRARPGPAPLDPAGEQSR